MKRYTGSSILWLARGVALALLCALVAAGGAVAQQKKAKPKTRAKVIGKPESETKDIIVRRAIGPGLFYPADPVQLRAAVEQYTAVAAPAHPGRLAAIVAPQSMYAFSGSIAGKPFTYLQPGQYDKVVILSPANHSKFRGCSIASVNFYATPMGLVPLDKRAIQRLTWNTLIGSRTVNYMENDYILGRRSALHEREHGDEVLLPFLQARLQKFAIAPIVVGQFENYKKGLDVPALAAVARAIGEIMDERTLLVISTDLTRYGSKFGFRPFEENVFDEIEKLDREAIDLILSRDIEGFRDYLNETRNPINGHAALIIMMMLLPERLEGVLLDYGQSGRMRNDTSSSVGFASMAFFDPALSPPEIRPIVKAASAVPEPQAQAVPQSEAAAP